MKGREINQVRNMIFVKKHWARGCIRRNWLVMQPLAAYLFFENNQARKSFSKKA